MKYNYVDIGTCDFDTAADVAKPEDKILLVEPVQHYLNRIPDRNNLQKVNLAVSDKPGSLPVYFIPEVTINTLVLPVWIRGCNSLGSRHPTVDAVLLDMGLPLGLVNSTVVEVITFQQLCGRYDITEIGKLKIDTEGHEEFILPGILEKVKAGMRIREIKFENQESLGNKVFLDNLVLDFVELGYTLSEVTKMDTTLKLL
jgi:FkbM family methyltransferase